MGSDSSSPRLNHRPDVRERDRGAGRLLLQLYGAGLSRMVAILARTPGAEAARLAGQIAHDELVGSALILHGLHPLDIRTRVTQSVSTACGSHSVSTPPDVKLLGIDDDGVVAAAVDGRAASVAGRPDPARHAPCGPQAARGGDRDAVPDDRRASTWRARSSRTRRLSCRRMRRRRRAPPSRRRRSASSTPNASYRWSVERPPEAVNR